MAKFAINASGAMLLPSLLQVSESISGSVVPLAMFFEFFAGHVANFSNNYVKVKADVIDKPTSSQMLRSCQEKLYNFILRQKVFIKIG